MSATYEQRRKAVADALWREHLHATEKHYSVAWQLAADALDALDHVPEKLDWVCEGQPRDQVTKGAA